MLDMNELSRRINLIKGLYAQYRLPIKPGEGLASIIGEAEKIVNGDIDSSYTDDKLRLSIEAYHYIWSLATTLETCINAGWDVSNHLGQMSTGTVNYGEAAAGHEKYKIYYKDFEYELFIGSALFANGLSPQLLPNPSDPKGDIEINDLFIETKHPNSSGQLQKLMRKFNNQMRINNSYGFFVIGMEDLFDMGDVFQFNDIEDFRNWNDVKRQEMDEFGEFEIIPLAKRFPRIIGLIQTSTKIYIVGDESKLVRHGNSALLMRRGTTGTAQTNADELAKVFNPNPTMIQC